MTILLFWISFLLMSNFNLFNCCSSNHNFLVLLELQINLGVVKSGHRVRHPEQNSKLQTWLIMTSNIYLLSHRVDNIYHLHSKYTRFSSFTMVLWQNQIDFNIHKKWRFVTNFQRFFFLDLRWILSGFVGTAN